MTDYKQLCTELVDVLAQYVNLPDDPEAVALLRRARAALAEPSDDAFAVVQRRLDQLAGNQEIMIYRWPDGEWTIDHTNPSSFVQLGEVSGEYSCAGGTLGEAVNKLAGLFSDRADPPKS